MRTSRDMDNVAIANLLRDIAASYEIEDLPQNKFKIIAYERAADAVEHRQAAVRGCAGVHGRGPSDQRL